jgi:hypothetical protein
MNAPIEVKQMSDLTLMLNRHSPDDSQSSEALLPLVYCELRKLAAIARNLARFPVLFCALISRIRERVLVSIDA